MTTKAPTELELHELRQKEARERRRTLAIAAKGVDMAKQALATVDSIIQTGKDKLLIVAAGKLAAAAGVVETFVDAEAGNQQAAAGAPEAK